MPVLTKTVTIANGASLSSAVEIGGSIVVGIQTPDTWTAANLTLQMSSNGTTFNNVYDDAGAEKTITAAAAEYILIQPTSYLGGADAIKVRSGTSGTPVNQGAERIITLVLLTV